MKKKITIYTAIGIDGFELCQPIVQENFEVLHTRLNGTPQKKTWKPIKVKIFKKDKGKELNKSDSPWLGSDALIFREEVIQRLGSLLEKSGEILQLEVKGNCLYIYNPWICNDALDHEKSDIIRFSSGRVMDITRYMFYEDKVKNNIAFKINDLRVSPSFFSQEFVNEWHAANFKGLDFVKVWKKD